MMDNGFSSSRCDAFPAGLRVLVVDDDLTWLKILEKMLKKCSYEVTTCCLARDALNLLRGRKDGYDIVISDVNMPDMDGFKLLEHVGLEMDLPVIMMSVDGETSRVMKGVQHGACDYLLKPIRMKELRNIWQHVLRKKIHEVRDVETQEGIDILQSMRHGSDLTEDKDGLFLSGEGFSSVKKRKDVDTKNSDFGDSSKKHRVVWTVELHQKFVEAVNQMGLDKVGPKRILDAMKVPWLTRENVASHLQKYRLYLSRLQKESDLQVSFNDTTEMSLLHNSISSHKNDAADLNFTISNNFLDASISQEEISEVIIPALVLNPEKAFIDENPNLHNATSLKIGFSDTLATLESEMQHSSNPTRYGWAEVPEIRFKQENEVFHIQVAPFQPDTSFCHEHEIIHNFASHKSSAECNANFDTFETIGSESATKCLISENASALASFDEDLHFSWLQSDNNAAAALHAIDFSEENDPRLLSEALRFDFEYPIIF